jgi:hypothetical protein
LLTSDASAVGHQAVLSFVRAPHMLLSAYYYQHSCTAYATTSFVRAPHMLLSAYATISTHI